ncbi:MAG TPA: FAD-dependent oxidoreductase [Terriglobia bacterium]|nr:FAD-dependent oxidoreductase [Terriglobia bacterium]
MKSLETDYVVIGSGIAGLRAAIDLAEAGRVTIFTKAQITESNSMYAQGGIAAAIGPDDDIDKHYRDTIAAGAGLCDSAAVRVLVEEGPREIEQLLSWGADFEKHGNTLALSREGGHSSARIVHGNGGLTGKVVVDALLARVRTHPNISIVPFSLFRDLVIDPGDANRVIGIQFEHEGLRTNCFAKATLLATGGGSQVYSQSTNPETATGDGLAAAYRAGAVLRDMEFVQFHPTALHLPGVPRFLLTEALRGDGGHIVNEHGDRFVDELLTRDEVSRAVFRQLTARPGAKAFLDVTHTVPLKFFATSFDTFTQRVCSMAWISLVRVSRSHLPLTTSWAASKPISAGGAVYAACMRPARSHPVVCTERIGWQAIPFSKLWSSVAGPRPRCVRIRLRHRRFRHSQATMRQKQRRRSLSRKFEKSRGAMRALFEVPQDSKRV